MEKIWDEAFLRKVDTEMTAVDINRLTIILARVFAEGPGPENFAEVFRQLLLLLLNGEPVSPDQIAVTINKPREEVINLLQELPNVELDNHGNLVGIGLTLRPTPHRFEVEGRTLFTWCALDALIFPAIIKKPVSIESPCPVTGTRVKVQVTHDRVEKVEPSSAVVSIVIPETLENIRNAFCNHVRFFSSSESATSWLADNPNAAVIPVADAYNLGRRIIKQFY